MFFQRLGFFVPKARWWTRNRWTSGLWAQIFLEGPSQKSWNRVFPKTFLFDPTCGSQFFFNGLQRFFKGSKQILCPRPAGGHQLMKKPHFVHLDLTDL